MKRHVLNLSLPAPLLTEIALGRAEARMVIFTWLEGWQYPHRRHYALGYLSPINYERKMLPSAA